MAMSYIWSGLVILSFLWGFFHGNLSAVAAAALDGAQSALELSLSMAGILCLWSGVMEILNVCGCRCEQSDGRAAMVQRGGAELGRLEHPGQACLSSGVL